MSSESNGGIRYLRTSAAAALLDVSRWTVGRWCRAGLFKGARKLRGHWQIPEASVAELIEAAEAA